MVQLRQSGSDLFDLFCVAAFMSRHELDPLIHVHRPEEGVIEGHLAQGQPVASSQRRAKRRMVALERCPSARHIHRAGRLRCLRRLSFVYAIAHPLLDSVRERRTRLRLG